MIQIESYMIQIESYMILYESYMILSESYMIFVNHIWFHVNHMFTFNIESYMIPCKSYMILYVNHIWFWRIICDSKYKINLKHILPIRKIKTYIKIPSVYHFITHQNLFNTTIYDSHLFYQNTSVNYVAQEGPIYLSTSVYSKTTISTQSLNDIYLSGLSTSSLRTSFSGSRSALFLIAFIIIEILVCSLQKLHIQHGCR